MMLDDEELEQLFDDARAILGGAPPYIDKLQKELEGGDQQ